MAPSYTTLTGLMVGKKQALKKGWVAGYNMGTQRRSSKGSAHKRVPACFMKYVLRPLEVGCVQVPCTFMCGHVHEEAYNNLRCCSSDAVNHYFKAMTLICLEHTK